MKTKTLINSQWVYAEADPDQLKVGDKVSFSCNGSGRGGHYSVTAIVTKLNKKTFKATEAEKSYRPGTPWRISKDIENLYILG